MPQEISVEDYEEILTQRLEQANVNCPGWKKAENRMIEMIYARNLERLRAETLKNEDK